MNINNDITAACLRGKLARFWELSGRKIRSIERDYDPRQGSPVFTVQGRYTVRGWTEWTEGFQYGAEILQFDAVGDEELLAAGRRHTRERMARHVTHVGVHDHGFNNVSTYGNLLRLMTEGRIPEDAAERDFLEIALKCSGAVQARRWTRIAEGGGYIYSFNGPHSLFADTIRSLRALAVAHRLGHVLMEENDAKVSLLGRLIEHARTTAQFNVFFGKGRDAYDVRGRVAHESIFNLNDGRFRCPNSQQGWSPFSTWTRGLAWIMCGFAEEMEFLASLQDADIEPFGGRAAVDAFMLETARATCDFYIDGVTAADGIPYWDTGAAELHRLGDWRGRPADPYNDFEPVDASAAAIAAQGLLRLGHHLLPSDAAAGRRYWQAGLTIMDALLAEPYLSVSDAHQGLLLHSVYHRPRGWDHIPPGRKIPCGESSMWGDYHIREAALLVQRVADGGTYPRFFDIN